MESFSDFSSSAQYRFVRRIGTGGSADVLLYRRQSTGLPAQDVVLKILKEKTVRAHAELLNEGRRLAQLRHPHIVSTFGYELVDESRAGLVMEYIPGETLKDIIARIKVEMRDDLARYVVKVVGDALSAAHEQNVVHGDISARNILVSETGVIKLSDFGLSINAVGSREILASQKGSVDYMAPERWQGESQTMAADVFSLGIVVLEILEGRNRLKGESIADSRRAMQLFIEEKPWASYDAWSGFLSACFCEDPVSRPSMRRLIEKIPAERIDGYQSKQILSCLVRKDNSPAPTGVTSIFCQTMTMIFEKKLISKIRILAAGIAAVALFLPHAIGVDHAVSGRLRPCMLTVTSRPWGEVFIDGQSVGFTPIVNVGLRTGAHVFTWISPKGLKLRRTISVFENGLLAFQIVKQKGRLLKVAPIKPIHIDL